MAGAGNKRRHFHHLRRWGRGIWRWLTEGQYVLVLLGLFLLVDYAVWTAWDVHRRLPVIMAEMASGIELGGWTWWHSLQSVHQVWDSALRRAILWGAPLFALWAWRRRATHPLPLKPVAVASVFFVLWLIPLYVVHGLGRAMTSAIGEEPFVGGFLVGAGLATGLLAVPWFSLWLYRRGGVMERYVLRVFLTPFLICFFAFVSIWLISDLANKGTDYAAAETPITDLARLYLLQLPEVTVIILPITLMLAVLYSLGRMSRSNELISMMMSGRSIYRILRPIFAAGLVATFVSLACNYEWAPTAAGTAESTLQSLSRGGQTRYAMHDQTFVNRLDNRIWFVGMFPHEYTRRNRLRGILVVQYEERDGVQVLQKTIQSNSAFWQDHDGLWVFFDVQVTEFDENGEPSRVISDQKHLEWDWPETPWLLMSTGIRPDVLGLPQIGAYLRAYADAPPERLAPFKTHWHYRLAMPFACFTAVLVAAPLGIVFSRRGLAGSVSAAIMIFFASIFVTNLLLALGQAGSMPPLPAAWLPNFFFAGVGCWLLHVRNRNRELPSLAQLRRRLGGGGPVAGAKPVPA